MTPDDIVRIMPHAKPRIAAFFSPLLATMEEFEVSTRLRRAAFLAQIGHESGQLLYVREIASGAAYDTGSKAKALGNTPEADGDGQRYKGRGLIQVTGRDNYLKCSEALFGDDRLLHFPELLEDPLHACRSAGWYWKRHRLNELADGGMAEFGIITRKINGGTNGMADRLALYRKALEVLA